MLQPSTSFASSKKGPSAEGTLPPRTSLILRMTARLAITLAGAIALVFLPAGSWRFWQGWGLLAAFFLPVACIFFYFYKHDPRVVERRLQSREKVGEQRLLVRSSVPLFVGVFLLPSLDFRWDWSRTLLGAVPLWLSVLSLAVICAAFLGLFWVLKVNAFASRTIQVEAGQRVITTGPYRFVRHPMYLACVAICLSIAPALGSWVAWPFFALLIPFYAIRLFNEEKVLREQLPGYTDYCLRTRYRLIPFVW